MSIRIFTIPFDEQRNLFQDKEVNHFLLNKQIKMTHPHFFIHQQQPFWSLYVEYEPIFSTDEQRKAPEEKLDGYQSTLLSKLKGWRREKADKDGVPAYVIATNIQLLDLVRKMPTTLESLGQVDGFGKESYP